MRKAESPAVSAETPDETLVHRVLEGEDEAFRILMARHYSGVYRLAYYWTGNRDDALDLCQECFVHLYRVMGKYDPQYRFRVWMYRVSANRCINWVKANRRARETVPFSHLSEWVLEFPDTEPSPLDRAQEKEARQSLLEAVHELPERYRAPIILRYMEDLSYKEIAAVLEISLKNVEIRIHRAKKMLYERLKDRLLGEEE